MSSHLCNNWNYYSSASVCMYACSLWLCPWKGTSTGPREESFQRSPIFPTAWAILAVMQPTLLMGTKVGPRNHEEEEVSQDHSRPFHNWPFRESNQWPPFNKQGKSPNPLPEGRPIASCGSTSLARSKKALMQMQEMLVHLSSATSPTPELSSEDKNGLVFFDEFVGCVNLFLRFFFFQHFIFYRRTKK